MVSLVGCIVPRLFVYWRGFRQQPPAAPRNLTRLPDHASYTTDEEPDVVLERAARHLSRRNRVATGDGWVAAERGQLREAGNLLFHLSVLIVLVGFGVGSLFGYKGGVILVVGNGFSNSLTPVRRLRPRLALRRRQDGAVLLHRRTTSRCSGSTAVRGRGWPGASRRR